MVVVGESPHKHDTLHKPAPDELLGGALVAELGEPHKHLGQVRALKLLQIDSRKSSVVSGVCVCGGINIVS